MRLRFAVPAAVHPVCRTDAHRATAGVVHTAYLNCPYNKKKPRVLALGLNEIYINQWRSLS